MYELKRGARIKEEIKIGDDVIVIDLDAEMIAVEYNKRYNDIIRAEQAVKKAQEAEGDDKTEIFNAYGVAVARLFGLIFGDDNAEKIINFYEHRFFEMTLEVFPFITDVVQPALSKALDEIRAKSESKYNQKQPFSLRNSLRR